MNKPTMKDLLNRYMAGKDNNQPEVLAALFSPDAVVTFDIHTPMISFPPKITGADNIAKVMFGDFHHNFTQVKSYYLNEDFACSLADQAECRVTNQKWLVSMQERDSNNSRFGTGQYQWLFEQVDGKDYIKAVHIEIHDMVSIADNGELLAQLQAPLNCYPWAEQAAVVELLKHHQSLHNIVAYLQP